jgi:hypothetical protein
MTVTLLTAPWWVLDCSDGLIVTVRVLDTPSSNSIYFLTFMNLCIVKNYENNQQDALYRLIYYSKSALHVSGDVFAQHQENLTVFTVSGSVHPSCCRQQLG